MLEQRQDVLRDGLVTPVPFSVTIGTSSTTIYTGTDALFLIRAMAVVNSAMVSANLTLNQGGDTWIFQRSIGSTNTTEILPGHMVSPNTDLTATGSIAGLRVYGWGLRIQGSGSWVL